METINHLNNKKLEELKSNWLERYRKFQQELFTMLSDENLSTFALINKDAIKKSLKRLELCDEIQFTSDELKIKTKIDSKALRIYTLQEGKLEFIDYIPYSNYIHCSVSIECQKNLFCFKYYNREEDIDQDFKDGENRTYKKGFRDDAHIAAEFKKQTENLIDNIIDKLVNYIKPEYLDKLRENHGIKTTQLPNRSI
jgi:hypothetical protein